MLGELLPELRRLRVLCLMRVVWSYTQFKLAEHFHTELILGQHAADGFFKNQFGLSFEAIGCGYRPQAGVTGVPGVFFLLPLSATKSNLFDIGDDHVVARVDVGRVGRAVLAHEDDGDLRRQTADDAIRRIDQMPLLLHFARLGHVSFHISDSVAAAAARVDRSQRSLATLQIGRSSLPAVTIESKGIR